MTKPSPARYRTTNWPSYNAALRKRGSLLIWLDKEMAWLAPHDGSPGRPAVFSGSAAGQALKAHIFTCARTMLGPWAQYLDPDHCENRALVLQPGAFAARQSR